MRTFGRSDLLSREIADRVRTAVTPRVILSLVASLGENSLGENSLGENSGVSQNPCLPNWNHRSQKNIAIFWRGIFEGQWSTELVYNHLDLDKDDA